MLVGKKIGQTIATLHNGDLVCVPHYAALVHLYTLFQPRLSLIFTLETCHILAPLMVLLYRHDVIGHPHDVIGHPHDVIGHPHDVSYLRFMGI